MLPVAFALGLATGSYPLTRNPGDPTVLYLSAACALAALFYLGYAMIRPESF